MKETIELTAAQLHPHCDPARFSFRSTEELPDLSGIIGQKRAIGALEFGMRVKSTGYNVFVLGPPGTGKATAVRQFIEADAAKLPPANDWLYVYNFHEPNKPNAIRLPAGTGVTLRDDLAKLLKELQRSIPAAFESEDYIKERDKIVAEFKEEQERMFQQLKAKVEQYSFSIIRLPGGFVLAPVVGGKPLTDEQFERLTEEQKEKVRKLREHLQTEVDKTLTAMRQRERDTRAAIANLDEKVARFTVEHPIGELKAKYEGLPEVLEHLDAMTEDLVANVEVFKRNSDSSDGGVATAMQTAASEGLLRRYSINLFVDNSGAEGAPVVQESNPNFANLVGRIEHQAVMGALITDFTMVRPGALHRANGGYLVMDALALLQRPQAYDALKRALKEKEIRVEEYAQSLGLISTAVLEPEPIPLDVKVVL
ncbi:MAG: ATP-dependent protease, partial [Caldilineae bacterium]